MALFDFLKKGKRGGAPKKSEAKARKDEDVKQKKQTDRKESPLTTTLNESRTAWHVLRAPHVTEKTTDLTAYNQYTFKLIGDPVKQEVKKSIEEIYGVHVEKIRKVVLPGKERRRGRRVGWRPGYTKAIITLRQGEKIEVLPH